MQPIAAVVIGGELNGLGVCRSLGRGGIRCYLVDPKRLNPGMWSRYTRPVLVPTLHSLELMDALLKLQTTLEQQPFLVITDELAALMISAHRDKLGDTYRFRLPAHDTVLMLHNKAQFHEFALSYGLPVPKGEIIRSSQDIGRIRALGLPLIIKPADKRHFHTGDAPRLAVARSLNDAMLTCERLLEKTGEVVVHEWVEGPDDNIYFSLFYRGRGGEIVSNFLGRKLASTPPGTGSTAFCTAAEDAREALAPITADFLDLVDYAGFGSVEYKWDDATRRFVIIEPTVGRTDWQQEIATLSGVNIPLDACHHEFKLPPLPGASADRRIVWQASYIERFKLGTGNIPAGATVFDGYWRLDDPLPAIVHYPHDVWAAAHRLAHWKRHVP